MSETIERLFVGPDAMDKYNAAQEAGCPLGAPELVNTTPLALLAEVEYEVGDETELDLANLEEVTVLLSGSADKVFEAVDEMMMAGVPLNAGSPYVGLDGTVFQMVTYLCEMCECSDEMEDGEQPCPYCMARAEAAAAAEAADDLTEEAAAMAAEDAAADAEEAAAEPGAAEEPPAAVAEEPGTEPPADAADATLEEPAAGDAEAAATDEGAAPEGDTEEGTTDEQPPAEPEAAAEPVAAEEPPAAEAQAEDNTGEAVQDAGGANQ